jgi:hypothetical protein
MKMTTLLSKHSPTPSPLRAFLLIPLLLACFALSPEARATCQDACLTNNNTVQGDGALLNLTTGTDNTALGFNALLSEMAGTFNTAVGSQALANHTTSSSNVAIGTQALFSSQSGGANVAVGYQALYRNISGNSNTGIGTGALYTNQASNNTAIGWAAATLNTSGNSNTAVGYSTLYVNQGSNNCAFGAYAVGANVFNSGSNNTAVGAYALEDIPGSNNTAIGFQAGQFIGSGDNNILIGVNAGQFVTGSNNIEIGAMGNQSDEGHIRIGKKGTQTVVHIAGIAGSTVASGVAVLTDNLGHLGTVTSSARFKENIQPMDKASEAILSLKPVTFRYKKELDPEAIPQFGLVAEDVEKVNPELVACDEQGKPYTVRYEAVNAMLLNEFLKEHRKNEEQESKIEQQDAKIAHQQKQIEALAAGLQKVSAQVELSKLTPQTVLNNH